MDPILKKIKKIEKDIQYHDTLYYKNAHPIISDFEYDVLKNTLAQLKQQLPNNQQTLTIDTAIPSDHTRGFKQKPHKQPMLSLDNTYNQDELYAFNDRLKRLTHQTALSYTLESKIDGLAISLTYIKGELTQALTRGNGHLGDDVTPNFQTIRDIPVKLLSQNSIPDLIEIRGEIYLDYQEFNRINELHIAEGNEPYANPRNLAAGTLKLLDPQIVATRKLQFIAHGIGACEPLLFETQSAIQKQIAAWGFTPPPHIYLAKTIEDAWGCINQIDTLRHQLPFATDGVVIKLNDLQLQIQAGYTAKSPRAMIAYKFAPEQAETRLKAITLQVGRTGVITPVAELDPVTLAGSTITRATLHNADEIRRKDIRINDQVIIEKAGDIIPVIIKSLPEKRTPTSQPFQFPSSCPACQTQLIQFNDEIAWRCPNGDCPTQIERRLIHFASKQAVDIENMGPAVIQQLLKKNLITGLTGIYELTLDTLLSLEGFAQKASENLIAAITKSKSAELWRFIHGLGMPHIGAQTAKDLAKTFLSLENLANATKDELMAIPGIGEKAAYSIIVFFQHPHNQDTLKQFKQLGICPTPPSHILSTFANKTFVLTGTLPTLTRTEAQFLIEKAGGKISNTVSKNTHYVIAGASAGSKLAKAESLNISILDEAQFKALLNIK